MEPKFVTKQGYAEFVEELHSEGIKIMAVYDLEEEYASFEEQLSADKPWFTGPTQQEENGMSIVNQMLKDLTERGSKVANDASATGGDLLKQLFQNVEQITITDPKEALSALGITKTDVAEMFGIGADNGLYTVYRVQHESFEGKEYVFIDDVLANAYAQLVDEQTGNIPDVLTSTAVKINDAYHLVRTDPFVTQEAIDSIANFTSAKIADQSVENRRKAALAKLSDEDKAILGLNA